MTLAKHNMFKLMEQIRDIADELDFYESEVEEARNSGNGEYAQDIWYGEVLHRKNKLQELWDKLYANPAYDDEDQCWHEFDHRQYGCPLYEGIIYAYRTYVGQVYMVHTVLTNPMLAMAQVGTIPRKGVLSPKEVLKMANNIRITGLNFDNIPECAGWEQDRLEEIEMRKNMEKQGLIPVTISMENGIPELIIID